MARRETEPQAGGTAPDESTSPATTASTATVDQDVNPHDPSDDAVEAVSHDESANVAAERAGVNADGSGPVGGRVDGQSRRSGLEVLQGHFCSIDRTVDGVSDTLKDVGALADRDGYGVYLEPATVDGDGYPDEALVRLRDDTHALVRVPYSALRPAAAGAR